MAWQPIDECGISRRTVYRMIEREELPSKTDKDGRRLVWLSADQGLLRGILREMADLRAAVSRVTSTAKPPVPDLARTANAPVPLVTPTANGPVPNVARPSERDARAVPKVARASGDDIDRGELLELAERVWQGSDAELERQAGVSQGWCKKQRQAQDDGRAASVRGRPARQAVLAVLRAVERGDTSPEPESTPKKPKPGPRPAVEVVEVAKGDVSRAELLELMDAVWTDGDQALERAAGISQAWVNKQRKAQAAGKPESPRGRPARMKVLAVLQQRAESGDSAAA